MKRIFVHKERCTGCKSCEIGCAVRHSESKTLHGAMCQANPPRPRIFAQWADGLKTVVRCNHCDDAPCISSCISGCLYKNEQGYVLRKKERCIGCWSCVMACPFGVVFRDPMLNIAVKCDGCRKSDLPACVESCPTKALELVDIEEIAASKRHHAATRDHHHQGG